MRVNEKMTAIADAIRDRTGGTEMLTLDDMATEVGAVYDAGKKSEHKDFWDVALRNQNYMVYAFAGCCWKDETFRPKYDIKPKGNITGMFRASGITNLKKCLEDAGVTLDLSQATNATTAFGYCGPLTTLPKLDFSSVTTLTQTFNDDTALETIEEIKFGENTKFNQSFDDCASLTHMIVTGVIGQNGLDLSFSPNLTHESLMSVINALQTKTSGSWTVTLGSTNLAKLTDTEKAIATQKGWTLV